MTSLVISSGHGLHIRGARGNPVPPYLDEVDEARRVVDRVAELLTTMGVEHFVFHDDVSTSQNENLNRIVNYHNSKTRDFDVSVHFNAYNTTSNPMGTECLYYSQSQLAGEVAQGISLAGHLTNRGPKKRTDLFFLNNTEEPAVLIEVCFVDSKADADLYRQHFEAICTSIANVISGEELPEVPPESLPVMEATGKVSWFGGPEDTGVSPSEGLAFIHEIDDAPELFLSYQPEGTTGLARRLDPCERYIAMRWDYDIYPKDELRSGGHKAKVTANGKSFLARPADWGPHESTGRICDISKGLMDELGVQTDDMVEVKFPG